MLSLLALPGTGTILITAWLWERLGQMFNRMEQNKNQGLKIKLVTSWFPDIAHAKHTGVVRLQSPALPQGKEGPSQIVSFTLEGLKGRYDMHPLCREPRQGPYSLSRSPLQKKSRLRQCSNTGGQGFLKHQLSFCCRRQCYCFPGLWLTAVGWQRRDPAHGDPFRALCISQRTQNEAERGDTAS